MAFEISLIHKRLNQHLPIFALPTEVLTKVMHDVAFDAPVTQSHSSVLYCLAQVSITWWSIVKSTPTLWARVTDYDPHCALAVRKSGGVPLRIEYSGMTLPKLLDPEAPFFDLVELEGERVHSVLCRWPYMRQPSRLLGGPALRRIELDIAPEWQGEGIPLPFLAKTLRTLVTRNVTLIPNQLKGPLPSLRILSMQEFHNNVGLWALIVDLLSNGRDMEVLKLHPSGHLLDDSLSWEDLLVASANDIDLPALRVLSLSKNAPCKIIRQLLLQARLTPGRLEQLHLYLPLQDQVIEHVSNPTDSSIGRAIRELASRQSPPLLICKSDLWRYGWVDGNSSEPTLDITFSASSISHLFGRLKRSPFDYPDAPPLLIQIITHDLQAEPSFNAFSAIPSVVHVDFSGSLPLNWAKDLSEPAGGQWLWSNLRSISVDSLLHQGRTLDQLKILSAARRQAHVRGDDVLPLRIEDLNGLTIDDNGDVVSSTEVS